MISVLILIAGIHSTTNLKIYEQAKNFFNRANTQSSSKESLKEKCLMFFETFINNDSRYKTQKVPSVGDARNIHKSFFIKSHY